MVSKTSFALRFKQKVEENSPILDLYIYDEIKGDTVDWFWGDTIESETSANHFKNELDKYKNVSQINLYVNSVGGDVYEAMSIRNQLKRHNAKVTGYVDGIAASAASFILTGCDEVKMYSNTMQMIHNMWTSTCGNADELRKVADDMDKMMEGNRQAYLEKSNGKLSEEKLIELLNDESVLTAQECLEYGLCDEIIEEEKDLNSANEMLQKLNKTFMQSINYNKALRQQYKEMLQLDMNKPPKKQEVKENIKLTNYEKLKQKFKKEGMSNEK